MSNISYVKQEINYDSIYENIPGYSEIIKTITEADLQFNSAILLPDDAAEFYISSKNTAIAFGMYSANLAYVRHFERVQLCMDYLNSVRVLAGKLAINPAEFNNLVPVFESSLNDKEEIFAITDSLLNYGSKWFSDAELQGLTALFLGGFWLESLYMGTADKNLEDITVKQALKSHFEILNIINLLFESIEDDSVISDFKSKLLILENKSYNNPELQDDILKLRKILTIKEV